MKVTFTSSAYKDYCYWEKHNPKIFKRIHQIIKDIKKKPYEGIGKPEPLKFDLQGYWSRRIDKTHRLIYTADNTTIVVISCKYHYSK